MKSFIPLLLLILIQTTAGLSGDSFDPDETVVTVNGTPIRQKEVLAEADRRIDIYAAASATKGLIYEESSREDTRAAMRDEVLHALIERRLTGGQLIADGIEITDADVEASFARKTMERGQTPAEAEKEIAGQGKTVRDVKERIRWNILAVERLYAAHAGREKEMTDSEALADYLANREFYRQEHERRVSHILVVATPDHDEKFRREAQARAKAILQRVRSGEDFGEVAKASSEDRLTASRGGDRGWSPRGFVTAPGNDPFGDAAFALKKVGDVSDLVETLDGYEIIKLTGLKEEHQMTFAEAKKTILERARYRRIERFWNAFAARMREAAQITWSPQELARKAEWQRKLAAGANAVAETQGAKTP